MPLLHHTVPTVVAVGVTGEVAKKALPTKKRTVKVATKKRKGTKPIKPKVRKQTPAKKKTTYRKPKTKKSVMPKGRWAQLSRAELVKIIGKTKADKVKAANGKPVKIGVYDRAIYINGKYYLSID